MVQRRDSVTSTLTTSSATRVNSAQPRAPAVAATVKKSGDRRRFKCSLTMNSIPVIVSEKVDSNMIQVLPPQPSKGGNGDGTEGPATKFTIDTSDEDDLEDQLEDYNANHIFFTRLQSKVLTFVPPLQST